MKISCYWVKENKHLTKDYNSETVSFMRNRRKKQRIFSSLLSTITIVGGKLVLWRQMDEVGDNHNVHIHLTRRSGCRFSRMVVVAMRLRQRQYYNANCPNLSSLPDSTSVKWINLNAHLSIVLTNGIVMLLIPWWRSNTSIIFHTYTESRAG